MKRSLLIAWSIFLLPSHIPIHPFIGPTISWIISAGWPTFRGLVGLEHILAKREPGLEEIAPPNVQSFVQQELQIGAPSINKLQVLLLNSKHAPEHEWVFGVDLRNFYIGVNHKTNKTYLETLLEKGTELTSEEALDLDAIRFVIRHERQHLLNNDLVRNVAIQLIFPNLLWSIMYKLQTSLSQNVPTAVATGMIVPIAILCGLINRVLVQTASRHAEQCADDGVTNDKKILQGGIRCMEILDEKEAKSRHFFEHQITQWPDGWAKKYVGPYLSAWYFSPYFASHPHPKDRIARLQRRLRELT